MNTTGRITNVFYERAGSGMAEETLAGATEIKVDANLDFNEEGGQCVINGITYDYTLGAEGSDFDILNITPALVNDVLQGEAVSTLPLSDVMRASVATDDNQPNSEDLECVVDYALTFSLTAGIREPGEGEFVTVSDESGELRIVNIHGQTPVVAPEVFVGPTPDNPTPTKDGKVPEYSPLPTTLGSLKSIFVRYNGVPNGIDLVTYQIHMTEVVDAPAPVPGDSATLAVPPTGTTMVAIKTTPTGEPLRYTNEDGTTKVYYFSVIATDADGAAEPSDWVAGSMDPVGTADLVTGAVTTEILDTVLAIVGVLQLGDYIELSPPTEEDGALRGGIIVRDPANPSGDPLIRLHPHGCRIKSDLYTDFVAVLEGLVLNGDMQVINGRDIMLEEGIPTPRLKPGVEMSTTVMGVWPTNNMSQGLSAVTATIDPWQAAAGGIRLGFLEFLTDGVSVLGRYLNVDTVVDGKLTYTPAPEFFLGTYPRGVADVSIAAHSGGGYRAYVLYFVPAVGTIQAHYAVDVYSWGGGSDPDNPTPVFHHTLSQIFTCGDVITPKVGTAKYARSAVIDVHPDGSGMRVAWVFNRGAANSPYVAGMAALSPSGDSFSMNRAGPVNLAESSPGVRTLVGLHWVEGTTYELVGAMPALTSAPTGTTVWGQFQPPSSSGLTWPKKAGTGFGRTPWAPQYTLKANGIIFSRDQGNSPNVRQWTDYIPPEVAENVVTCYADTVGGNSTAASPVTDPIQILYRCGITVTAPAAPPGVTGKLPYFKKSSDEVWRVWPESESSRAVTFDPSRTTIAVPTTPPAVSTIPDSDPARVLTRSGDFVLKGDGTGDWPLLPGLVPGGWVVVNPTGGAAPAFNSGVSAYGGAFEAPSFRKEGRDLVRLRGLASRATNAGASTPTTLFTLPVGYRPAKQLIHTGSARITSGAASAGTAHTHVIGRVGVRIDILPTGEVQLLAETPNAQYVSLDGIVFVADHE